MRFPALILALLWHTVAPQDTHREAEPGDLAQDAQHPSVATLAQRVTTLEHELRGLEHTVAGLHEQVVGLMGKTVQARSQASPGEAETVYSVDATGFSRFYKIKQKPWERTVFDLSVSFEVYAGDTYLGDFWQSNPIYRLLWDEMCFFDDKERFRGQLWVGFWK